ncbi:MAG: phosphotransferase [Planctomycetota bacterium]
MDPNHLPIDDSSPYHDALAQGVEHWGLVAEKTELVRDGINHVFCSELTAGEPIIIRIGDGALRSRGEVMGELLWLDHLIRHGCTVTTPIRSCGGELLETIPSDQGEMHVCCFQRFGGRQLDPATDAQWNDDLLVKVGREIGRVHRVSDEFQLPPDRDRRAWYDTTLLEFPTPLPRIYDARVVDAMQAFVVRLREKPTPPRHYGLVHRDLHAGNFLVEDGQVELIDFDLGCYGWRTMDFAVLLFSHYYYPSLQVPGASPELAGHVLAKVVQGYREQYALDRAQLDEVTQMILLHTILNYVVAPPAVEHWQIAMGNPQPPVTESIAWIEQLWLSGCDLPLDLAQIPS